MNLTTVSVTYLIFELKALYTIILSMSGLKLNPCIQVT